MGTRNFHWDPIDDCVTQETDQSGDTIVTYTHEPGHVGQLLSENRGGTEFYHHYDALGSTTMLTNDAGTVTDTFQYDAWGNNVATTGTTPTPYQWNGRWGYQLDMTTGVFYIRARTYSPIIARWLSPDPVAALAAFQLLGIVVGYNDFKYAGNNPSLMVDFSGLVPITIDMVAKSFINGAFPAGAIVPNRRGALLPTLLQLYFVRNRVSWWLATNATARLLLFAAGASLSQAFNQNPTTDVKDGKYRMYTRMKLEVECCDNSISVKNFTNDKDGGLEIPFWGGLGVYGTINISPMSVRTRGNTIIVIWRGWGRPNQLVEPGMQWIATRTSVNIWHKPEVWITCNNGRISIQVKSFQTSQFPTHLLWINGVPFVRRTQLTLSRLWYPSIGDETFVVGRQ